VEARRVLKTPELTANCHFCEDTRAGVRYYTPRVRRARLLKKVGEAYAIKYGIGTPDTIPPMVELDRSRSNVQFLVQVYVDELMCLMAVHVECTSTVP